MKTKALLAGALVLSGLSAAPTFARSFPPFEGQEAKIDEQSPRADFRADVEMVRLNVAVIDPDSGVVPNLKADDFKVYDDGVPQDIALFLAPYDSPVDVALVLDSSTSMVPVAATARRAARQFLALLEVDDCVFVLPFSEVVGPGRWGRAGDPEMTSAVDRIVMAGGTSLYDALLFGLDELERAVPSERHSADKEVSDPADEEVSDPAEVKVSDPAEVEVSEPAEEEAGDPLDVEVSEPADNEKTSEPAEDAERSAPISDSAAREASEDPPESDESTDEITAETEVSADQPLAGPQRRRRPLTSQLGSAVRVAASDPGSATGGRCGSPDAMGPAGSGSARRQALVVVSDGADENSRAGFESVLRQARMASVPIFPVALGYANEDPRLKRSLAELARATGGRLIESLGPQQLREAYGDVVNLLRASYLIGYYPLRSVAAAGEGPRVSRDAASRADGLTWHEIRLELRRPKYRPLVRPGYYR